MMTRGSVVSAAVPRRDSTGARVVTETLDVLVERARSLVGTGERRILGVVGTPGSGKSTVSSEIAGAMGSDVVVVGMDAFHLANRELIRLGRRERKGAPDTFDVDGYATLLARLRAPQAGNLYAPVFDRGLEESIGSAILVTDSVPLVVTEGNYLLSDGNGWESIARHLDEIWFIEIDATERRERLLRRRTSYGHAPDAAARWVDEVDEPNARLIELTRDRADLLVTIAPNG
jgi:pantothenate kinase